MSTFLKIFGFYNTANFGNSLMKYQNMKLISTLSVVMGVIAQFTEKYIGISLEMYFIFILLILLEIYTGIKSSIMRGVLIKSRSFGRTIIKMSIYTIILFILNIASHKQIHNQSIFGVDVNPYHTVYYIVFNGIVLQLLLSVWENLVAMGWKETKPIFRAVTKFISKWFDMSKTDNK